MRVALAQMPVVSDVSENVKTLLRAVRFAVDQRADVLLTPEGSLSGYTHQFNIESVEAGLVEVTTRARESQLALALSKKMPAVITRFAFMEAAVHTLVFTARRCAAAR